MSTKTNGKKVKMVTIDTPRQKKPVKKTIVKKVKKDTKPESDISDNDSGSYSGSESNEQSETTYSTNDTNRLRKVKDFNDDTHDAQLTSSNLPPNLLEDEEQSDVAEGKAKNGQNKTSKTVKMVTMNTKTNTKNANSKNTNSKGSKKVIKDADSSNMNVKLADTDRKPPDPASIYTDPDELREKLRFYKRVESKQIADLPLGTRVKYIEVLKDKKFKYKPGGVIMVNKAPLYLVLAENRKSWSVQLDRHIIFAEQFELVRKSYEDRIKKLTEEVTKVTELNKKLKYEVIQLKKKQEDAD
ncbi:hypothetical protein YASMINEVIRUS_18 [Yasminevirus sp. GU-2018]|uniref:Uncharacterized protein n=1 Tax=Yasminevirus sp. GU-2018 TaxID=2420051 RepID=A0A5K0U8V3_9VIRU|nr:hypothetical protein YASMINEVIRUS_18 [Yasminevirus sp. GU-2018]